MVIELINGVFVLKFECFIFIFLYLEKFVEVVNFFNNVFFINVLGILKL